MSMRVVKTVIVSPADRPAPIELEVDQRAFAAADPVALHGADFFRPALKLVEVVAATRRRTWSMRRNHCSSSRCSTRVSS